MQECAAFIDTLCEPWGLPKPAEKADKEAWLPQGIRIPASMDAPPQTEPHDLDWQWESDRGRLWFQVDCRSVIEFCNGRGYLKAPELRPLFVRISRALLFILLKVYRLMLFAKAGLLITN